MPRQGRGATVRGPRLNPVEQVFREEYGRLIASLVRRFGIEVAEEAAGEALVVALEQWPVDGVPRNPGAWLTTTASRKALDRVRREGKREEKEVRAVRDHDDSPHEDVGLVEDDRLRLVFTCCHPALSQEARIALTLRLLGGLSVAEIAAAFLVPETTMAQRITRAKQKIAAARIPFRVPGPDDVAERLDGVLTVLFLAYNGGYLGDRTVSAEAVRLARVLHQLTPEPEATGLLALLLLTEARAASRVRDGVLVPLVDQDRAGWDDALVAEGHGLVRQCLALGRPGRFQLLAAINAVHTDGATDWSQVVALYDQLLVVDPSPVVALNRAVAVAELDGPQVALTLVDALPLDGYHPLHAVRADLLRRLGRSAEAAAEYERALAGSPSEPERAYLARRLGELVT